MSWKVPFRDCYADTFGGWVKYTLWCHVVLPVYSEWIDQHGGAA